MTAREELEKAAFETETLNTETNGNEFSGRITRTKVVPLETALAIFDRRENQLLAKEIAKEPNWRLLMLSCRFAREGSDARNKQAVQIWKNRKREAKLRKLVERWAREDDNPMRGYSRSAEKRRRELEAVLKEAQ